MIAPLATGLVAGAVHVWSGPDHLVAIAPLSVRQPRRAWVPGVRWGIGHSAGVGIVGGLSLLLRDLLPVEQLSLWGVLLVGVLLIGIGIWAFRKASRVHFPTAAPAHDGTPHVHGHAHDSASSPEHRAAHHQAHAALGIGILHGLAGSSHFLAVLPVLALPTRTQATGYLIAYAVGTIASMALFSWAMGWLGTRFKASGPALYRSLMYGCAFAAIAVGIYWIITGFP